MTPVGAVLARAKALGVDRLDAQLLVAHHVGVERGWLIAHPEARLSDAQAAACVADCRRRADGVPLAYLVGRREFHGLQLAVTPAVLDPRPDTEVLVDWALELLSGVLRSAHRIVDLGTGSGAIALAIRHAEPRCEVHATDAHGDALEVAAANAARLGLPVTFSQGSWWDAVPGMVFDLALSNPPYVGASDPHLAALRHEPRQALTPGEDALTAIEPIVAGAFAHLRRGGWLLLEHGFDQADAVRERFASRGFIDIETRNDLASHPRCTGGRRP